MDSSTARRELPKGMVPVPASAVPTLHPAVASAVAERPDSFGVWTPAQVCLFWSETVDVDGRRIEEKGGELQTVGVWSVLARPADDAAAGPRGQAVALFASNWRAATLARAIQIDVDRAEAASGKVPVEDAAGRLVPGADDRFQLRLGKATITWDGRLAGDPASPAAAAPHEWHAPGLRLTNWTVRGSVQPETSRPVVGALRVTGKDDLARALQASPIRFVGPWHSGGTAQLVFAR